MLEVTESGVNEPRRSEGHEGRRKKEEGRVGQLALEFTRLFLVKMPGF